MRYFLKLKNKFVNFIHTIRGYFLYLLIRIGIHTKKVTKINVGCGTVLLDGYCNIDIFGSVDLVLDLEKKLLPFRKNSIDSAVCISAINYFSRDRGEKIIRNIYEVLKPGGVMRIGTQDLRLIAEKYVHNDIDFFFQKLPNGKERFLGETMCDKFNSWFYGYAIKRGRGCKYFYDYETLEILCKKAGFRVVEKRNFMDSRIPDVEKIDNRPDQMFFLEALK